MDILSEPQLSSAARPPSRSAPAGAFSLRDLLTTLFFYWRTALGIVLTVTVLAVLLALLLPPSYTARARVLTLNAGAYNIQTRQSATPADDSAEASNVELQLLASPELHRSLGRMALGVGATPEALNQWVRHFQAHLHLARLESSNVVEATFTDRDPQHAASELQLLLNGYFAERANVLTSGRVGFLTAQRDKLRAQLDQVDTQIASYERGNGIVDIAGQVNGAVASDNLLRQRQQDAEAELAGSQKNVRVLIANGQNVPREIELYTDNSEATHTLGTMQATLLQLEAKRADLASRYMPESAFVQQADAQIRELQAAIDAQRKTLQVARRSGYNTNRDTVQDQLISAEANFAGVAARHQTLNAQVATSASRLKALITVSDTLTRLHTQHDLLAETVKNYSEQVEQARVEQNQAATVGSTNVRVIESPVAPSRADNPPLMILAAGVFSAFLLAALSVFLLASLRETFLTPEEVERALGLPVLCTLPRNTSNTENDSSVRRYFGPAIAAIAGQPAPAGGGKVVLLLTPNHPSGLESTARGLLSALEVRAPGRNAVLQLLSPSAKPIPVNLQPEAVKSLPVDAPRNVIADALALLRSAYPCVLVAAPPASESYESVEASVLADVILLVLQAEATRKAVAEDVISQVAQVGARVDGVVLTGRRFHIPGWAYRLFLHQGLESA